MRWPYRNYLGKTLSGSHLKESEFAENSVGWGESNDRTANFPTPSVMLDEAKVKAERGSGPLICKFI